MYFLETWFRIRDTQVHKLALCIKLVSDQARIKSITDYLEMQMFMVTTRLEITKIR